MLKNIRNSHSLLLKQSINKQTCPIEARKRIKSIDSRVSKNLLFSKDLLEKEIKNQNNLVCKNKDSIIQDNCIKGLNFPGLMSIHKGKTSRLQLNTQLNLKNQQETKQLNFSNYNVLKSQIETNADMMLAELKKHYIFNQFHTHELSIKKKDLIQFIQKLLIAQFKIPSIAIVHREDESLLSFLNDYIQNVKKYSSESQLAFKRNKLKLNRNQSIKYSDYNYRNEVIEVQTELSSLQKTRESLEQNNQFLMKHKNALLAECAIIQQRFNQLKYSVQLLSQDNTIRKGQSQNILNQISKNTLILNQISQKSKKILNFVDDQTKNKHVKMASEHYKEIEADIYEYASYLQANSLASNQLYEPISFLCLSQGVQSKLKAFNRNLLQSQQSSQEKSKLMRDFLMESIDKFRKKDEESQTLLQFKTKCIRTFINKMKRWLDNWSLKQQYLVNLRESFAYDSGQLTEDIESLIQIAKKNNCIQCFNELLEKKAMLIEKYDKIVYNYSMGNSFY